MALRRAQGRIARAAGGVLFMVVVGAGLWWGLSHARSGEEEGGPPSESLIAADDGAAKTPTTRPGTPELAMHAMPSPTAGPTTQPVLRVELEDARAKYKAGVAAIATSQPVQARRLLSDALDRGLSGADEDDARQRLQALGRQTIFSRARLPDDPLVDAYVVKSGDNLAKIAAAHNVSEDLLAEVNQLRDKHFIRIGQTLKVIHGPFHAIVDKSEHEMYILLKDLYVGSFRVALGMNGSTPTGKWIVANHLKNPSWFDPRTGKQWLADDPQNPIGERWIGLAGVEGDAKDQTGFGIHGTIEEETIGRDVSLGCIRLGARDVEFVYKLLEPNQSTVIVRD